MQVVQYLLAYDFQKAAHHCHGMVIAHYMESCKLRTIKKHESQ